MQSLKFFLEAPEKIEEQLEKTVKHAAVSLILCRSEKSQLLMIQRAERTDDPWSGQMAFPGGREEDADENLLATAQRETFEEIGVDLSRHTECLGGLPPIQARQGGQLLSFSIAPFVFLLKDFSGFTEDVKLDPLEVANLHWISLQHLSDQSNRVDFLYRTTPEKIYLPSIRFEEHKIWGLSYMMLLDLQKRLKNTSKS